MNSQSDKWKVFSLILTQVRALQNNEDAEVHRERADLFHAHLQDAYHERRDLSLDNSRYEAACRVLHDYRKSLSSESEYMDFTCLADDWGFDLSPFD